MMKKLKLFLTVIEIVCIAVAPVVIVFFNAATAGDEGYSIHVGISAVLLLAVVAWIFKKFFLSKHFQKNYKTTIEALLIALGKTDDEEEIERLKSSVRRAATAEKMSGAIMPGIVIAGLYLFTNFIESYLTEKIGVPVIHLSGTIGLITVFVTFGFMVGLVNAQIVPVERKNKARKKEEGAEVIADEQT